MNTIKIRNIVLGNGSPKIAVPNVGTSEQEILSIAKKIVVAKPDLMEWRIDYFENVTQADKLTKVAQKLRSVVGELPILVTFRTKAEGGIRELNYESDYFNIVETIILHRLGDAVDIELFHDETRIRNLIKAAHNYNVIVVMSNHDFEKVPAKDVIEFRLQKMDNMGADIPKFACMPHNTNDVLTLLTATNNARQKIEKPLITMAMGDLGKVSRVAGQVFGSTLSFASVGKASAPGQLSIVDLRRAEAYLKLD